MSKESIRTQIRLPVQLHGALIKMSESKGVSLNSLMVNLLWTAYLEEDERKECPNAIGMAVVDLVGNLNQLSFEQLRSLADITASMASDRIKLYGYEESNKFVNEKEMFGIQEDL